MSGLTLRALLDANPSAYAAAAQQWQAMAEDLDNAAEQLIRGTRDLADVWPQGPASRTAHDKAARLRTEVSNAYNPCRRIHQALREHADALPGLQQTARSIIGEARGAGLTVDEAAGTVTAPQAMYDATSAPHTVAQMVNAYVHQLTGVLDRAADLDSRTTTAITANLPDGKAGFGQLSLPRLDRAALEAQRGRSPEDVNAWWLSLTPQQQEQAIADFPELVGWLAGVPATDRDTANRLFLDRRLGELQTLEDDLRRRIADLEATRPDSQDTAAQNELYALRQELAATEAAQAKLAPVQTALAKLGDQGFLLGLDPQPGGDGKVIIAVGNPDTARHTGVWVPGLGTTIESTRGNVDRMLNLQREADLLTLDAKGDVSTVMWLGYDAPELTTVAFEQRSRDGAGPYLNFMEGMRATYQGDDQHLTAMGHSYGSTVVGEAAKTGRLPVDDIITAGSPGTHADRADQLMTDPRHVWAGTADNDPVSRPENVGRYTDLIPIVGPVISHLYADGHNISPHEPEFGANQYVVDTSGHSAYWDVDSQSLQNQAAVLVGQYSRAGLEHGQAPPDLR